MHVDWSARRAAHRTQSTHMSRMSCINEVCMLARDMGRDDDRPQTGAASFFFAPAPWATQVLAHRKGLVLLHLLPGPKMPPATKLNFDHVSYTLTDESFGTQRQ